MAHLRRLDERADFAVARVYLAQNESELCKETVNRGLKTILDNGNSDVERVFFLGIRAILSEQMNNLEQKKLCMDEVNQIIINSKCLLDNNLNDII